MDRPIFLIGAARSGTTVLAEVLSAHPDIAFRNEPRYVWRHGNHAARNDARGPEEAVPEVVAYIRGRFEEFLAGSGRTRFLEKTPSNCFRVGFIHRIFPDGLFLHLQRDGRDAAASALRRWCSEPDDQAIMRRLRGFEIPVTALHHYLPDILYELVLRRLRPGRGYLWGPRYPGIHEDLAKGLPVAEICARQWAESERIADAALSLIPDSQRYSCRYETLVSEPERVLEEIRTFAGLRPSDEVTRAARDRLKADRVGGRSRLPAEQQQIIESTCMPVMRTLGIAPAEFIQTQGNEARKAGA